MWPTGAPAGQGRIGGEGSSSRSVIPGPSTGHPRGARRDEASRRGACVSNRRSSTDAETIQHGALCTPGNPISSSRTSSRIHAGRRPTHGRPRPCVVCLDRRIVSSTPAPQPMPADHRLDSVRFAVWVPEPIAPVTRWFVSGAIVGMIGLVALRPGSTTRRPRGPRPSAATCLPGPGGPAADAVGRVLSAGDAALTPPARVLVAVGRHVPASIPSLRAAAARRQRVLNVEADDRGQTFLDHRRAARRELGLTDTRTLRIRPDGHVHGALTVLRTESGDTDTQGQTILPPQGGPRGAARPSWRTVMLNTLWGRVGTRRSTGRRGRHPARPSRR